MHDVFISFSFKNITEAQHIVNGLQQRHGIRCWICTREIYGGKYYKEEIEKAIMQSQVVVLVQTKEALASREVPKEIAIAFEENKVIIPFRLDDAKAFGALRYDLSNIDFIDGVKPTLDERIDDLAAAVKRNLSDIQTGETSDFQLKSHKLFCNEIFVGRDRTLTELEAAFDERNVVFLYGMGGIGKSEIAKQYAKKRSKHYHTVVFARYDASLAALIADDRAFSVSGLQRKTKADNTMQDDAEYAREKLAVLSSAVDGHTLIVIDNFDVADDPLLQHVTETLPCHLLFTTRCKPETGRFHTITVRELDDDALRDMMICYADPEENVLSLYDPDFPALFDLTDRHTLTLELIAKRMTEDGIDEVGEMVQLLKAGKLSSLTGDSGLDAYGRIRDLFRLSGLNEQECSFLRCLALMPPDGVLQKLFRQWMGDDFSVRAHLMKLSLIRLDTQTKKLFLHPILREVIINELQPCFGNCRAFIERCAMVDVENASGQMWNFDYTTKKHYLDAYTAILQFMPEVTQNNYLVFQNMLVLFNYVGDVSETMVHHHRLLSFITARFGENSLEAAYRRYNMGWKYSNAQMFEQAASYLQQASDCILAAKDVYTHEDQFCLNTCSHAFAYLSQRTGDPQHFETAKVYLQKCLEIADERFKAYSLQHTYFKYCCMTGDYQQAAVHAQAYHRYCEEHIKGSAAYRIDHSYALYHSATILANTGREKEAIPVLEQTIAEYREFFSTKNARIVDMYELLVKCYQAAGTKSEVLACAEVAVGIAQILYTQDHPQLRRLKAIYEEYAS